jgi:hypothetical protein
MSVPALMVLPVEHQAVNLQASLREEEAYMLFQEHYRKEVITVRHFKKAAASLVLSGLRCLP